jgi:hypothetical protein
MAGGIVGGLLLGYIHVFLLAIMALLTASGYRYIGQWAFFLNGTAAALFMALIVGIPLGLFIPGVRVRLALVLGGVAGAFLLYLGAGSASERWFWIPIADAVQLTLLLVLGIWLGSRLSVLYSAAKRGR